MPEGVVIKALSGFYYVRAGDETVECRARGRFRLDGESPLVGRQGRDIARRPGARPGGRDSAAAKLLRTSRRGEYRSAYRGRERGRAGDRPLPHRPRHKHGGARRLRGADMRKQERREPVSPPAGYLRRDALPPHRDERRYARGHSGARGVHKGQALRLLGQLRRRQEQYSQRAGALPRSRYGRDKRKARPRPAHDAARRDFSRGRRLVRGYAGLCVLRCGADAAGAQGRAPVRLPGVCALHRPLPLRRLRPPEGARLRRARGSLGRQAEREPLSEL